MPMLIIQLAILIAVAFVIGCVLGRLIRGKKAADTNKENTIIAAALSKPAVDEKPEPVTPTKAVVVEEPLKDKVRARIRSRICRRDFSRRTSCGSSGS